MAKILHNFTEEVDIALRHSPHTISDDCADKSGPSQLAMDACSWLSFCRVCCRLVRPWPSRWKMSPLLPKKSSQLRKVQTNPIRISTYPGFLLAAGPACWMASFSLFLSGVSMDATSVRVSRSSLEGVNFRRSCDRSYKGTKYKKFGPATHHYSETHTKKV